MCFVVSGFPLSYVLAILTQNVATLQFDFDFRRSVALLHHCGNILEAEDPHCIKGYRGLTGGVAENMHAPHWHYDTHCMQEAAVLINRNLSMFVGTTLFLIVNMATFFVTILTILGSFSVRSSDCSQPPAALMWACRLYVRCRAFLPHVWSDTLPALQVRFFVCFLGACHRFVGARKLHCRYNRHQLLYRVGAAASGLDVCPWWQSCWRVGLT